MKKELISEISRIHEIMGVKNATIIKESTGCPLCDVINSKIDDLARKYANKDIGYPRFQYEVDELLRKVELSGKLNFNEVQGLAQIKKNLDNLKKTSDSIDVYKVSVKNAISNTTSLSDRTLKSAKEIRDNVINKIDWDAISKTQEYSDYVFKNSSEVADTLSTVDNLWLSKTEDEIKQFVDYYKTIDSYAENIKKAMKSYFIESGIEETLAENLSSMFKTWTKDNPNINKNFPKTSPVIDDTADDVVDVVDDVGADLNPPEIKKTSDSEIKTIFEENRTSVDIEGIKNVDHLRKKAASNTKTDSNWGLVDEVNTAIMKGKKIDVSTYSDDLIRNVFKETGDFSDEQINTYLKLLRNPVKGYGIADYVWWNIFEPIFKRFTVLIPEIITKVKVALGIMKKPTQQDLVDNFMEKVQKMMLTPDIMSDPRKLSAALKELRVKFGQLRSINPTAYPYYQTIWKDLDSFMRKELSGSVDSIKLWDEFIDATKAQKDGFLSSSWNYLLKRTIDEKGLAKDIDLSIIPSYAAQKKNIEQVIKSNKTQAFFKKLKNSLLGYFLANTFRTPKQMEQFFIDNAYRTSGTKWSLKNPFGFGSAAVANIFYGPIIRYIYIPVVGTALIGIVEMLMSSGSNVDPIPGELEDYFKMFINGFNLDGPLDFSGYPEWYQTIKNNKAIDWFTPPAADVLLQLTAWYTMEKVPIEKAIEDKTKEGYNEGVKKANEEALKKYENSDEATKEEIKKRSQYTTTLYLLTSRGYRSLSKVQQDCLKNKILFEPTPTIGFQPTINVKKIDVKSTIDDVKNTKLEDLLNSDEIKKGITTNTIGNTVFKGKDNKKYVLVPAYSGKDPLGVLDKTSNKSIIDDGAAIVLPAYEDIKPGITNYQFISLKEFADKYIECSK